MTPTFQCFFQMRHIGKCWRPHNRELQLGEIKTALMKKWGGCHCASHFRRSQSGRGDRVRTHPNEGTRTQQVLRVRGLTDNMEDHDWRRDVKHYESDWDQEFQTTVAIEVE